jgi:hypothetical protein
MTAVNTAYGRGSRHSAEAEQRWHLLKYQLQLIGKIQQNCGITCKNLNCARCATAVDLSRLHGANAEIASSNKGFRVDLHYRWLRTLPVYETSRHTLKLTASSIEMDRRVRQQAHALV